jgi:hypothetical protein
MHLLVGLRADLAVDSGAVSNDIAARECRGQSINIIDVDARSRDTTTTSDGS